MVVESQAVSQCLSKRPLFKFTSIVLSSKSIKSRKRNKFNDAMDPSSSTTWQPSMSTYARILTLSLSSLVQGQVKQRMSPGTTLSDSLNSLLSRLAQTRDTRRIELITLAIIRIKTSKSKFYELLNIIIVLYLQIDLQLLLSVEEHQPKQINHAGVPLKVDSLNQFLLL